MHYRKYSLKSKAKLVFKFIYSKMKIPIQQFCSEHSIPRTTFKYWLKQFKEQRLFTPKKSSGRKTKITPKLVSLVKYLIETNPFQSIISVYKKCVNAKFDISLSLIYTILHNDLQFSYKKCKFFIRPDKHDPNTVIELIKDKQHELQKIGIKNLVSIDEMPIYEEMHPTYGWCKRGKVILQRKRSMRSKKYSLLMAINSDGIVGYTVYEKSINTQRFKTFLSRKVIPNITSNSKLLMDNVSFHKTKKITNYLATKNVDPIFTVPYTPDLNPIENVFSIVKHYIKKKRPKTLFQLKNAVAGAMPLLTTIKLSNMYKRSMGLTNFRIDRF